MVDLVSLIKDSGIPYKLDVEAKNCTSYRGGGRLQYVVYPTSSAHLSALSGIINKSCCRYFVMGAGTNCLIKDGGYSGLVICTARLGGVAHNNCIITCGGGLPLPKAVALAAQHNLGGINALAGLPCSVGGAIYMNAGSFGTQISDVLDCVDCCSLITGECRRLQANSIPFTYRSSGGVLDNSIIYSATLRLAQNNSGNPPSYYIQERASKQPKEPSLGCVFTNPPTLSAGYLIDKVGLKGYRIGGAAISEKHANFIVNKGGGTAGDYIALMQLAKAMVYNEFKIELQQEIKILG